MAIILDGTTGITTPGLINTGSETVVNLSTTGTTTLGDASGDALTINSSAVSIPNGLNFDSNTFVIDATNNRVGVGTASPGFPLDISADAAVIRVTSSTTTNGATTRYINGSGTGYVGLDNSSGGLGAAYGLHLFHSGAYPVVMSTNGVERMRIDSSGNVGIGTSSPLSTANQTTLTILNSAGRGNLVLSTGAADSAGGVSVGSVSFNGGASSSGNADGRVAGIFCSTEGATANNRGGILLFNTKVNNGDLTERMRIDSSGNLLVGTTSQITSEKLGVLQAANASGISINTNNTSFTGVSFSIFANRNTTNNTFYAMQYYNSAAGLSRFLVADSGNVTNTNNSYGAISDVKLKENIVDATPKLEQLCQVKVRNYNLIGDSTKQIGVVAQELEEVFPSMVEEAPDRDAEGNDLGTVTKQVKYSVFVPMLIKAIQEQQAIITDLKARIEALESK